MATATADRGRVSAALEAATFREISIEDLNIDHRYQRDLSMSLVQRIAANWNPVAGEPILVSQRSTGKLFVVNGQHRTSSAKIVGKEKILCRVVKGLTQAEEAELRLQTNVQVSERPADRFKAQLAAGYKESIDLMRRVNAAGVEINLDAPDVTKGINAISTLEMIYRIDRGATLSRIMELLSGQYHTVSSANASAPVLRALAWFFVRHENEVNDDWLRKALKEMSAAAWTKKTRVMQNDLGGATWLSAYKVLVEAYNDAAPAGGKLKMQTKGGSRLPTED